MVENIKWPRTGFSNVSLIGSGLKCNNNDEIFLSSNLANSYMKCALWEICKFNYETMVEMKQACQFTCHQNGSSEILIVAKHTKNHANTEICELFD